MDHIIISWQEYVSLLIVALAVVGIVRHFRLQNSKRHQCSTCALMETQKKKQNA